MRNNLLIVFLLFSSFISFAQQHELIVKTETNTFDNSINFTAQNNSFCTYTVYINFRGLEGYTSSLLNNNIVEVNSGINSIGKLERLPKNGVYNYSYNYSYFVGKSLRKIPDTNFVYLLPANNGTIIQCSNGVHSIEERLGQKNSNNYHEYFFKFQLDDTICAIRGGVVYSLSDEMKDGEKKNQTYSSSRDKINIEQKDGTLAHYTFTAPVKILVTTGDKVIAGQPIAIFNTPSEKLHLLLSVNYLNDKKLRDFLFLNNDVEKRKEIYQYLPIKFYLNNDFSDFIKASDKYNVLHPVSIITQEMTKKELKKFNQPH